MKYGYIQGTPSPPVSWAAPGLGAVPGGVCLAARGRTLVLTALRARAHPLAARIMGGAGVGGRAGGCVLGGSGIVRVMEVRR